MSDHDHDPCANNSLVETPARLNVPKSHQNPTRIHRLSLRLAPVAILMGALVGAGLVAGFFSLPILMFGTPDQAVWLLSVSFTVAGIFWLLGLIFVAVPCWMTLHGVSRRGPKDAAMLGAGLTFSTSVLLNLLISQGVTLSSVDGRASIIDGERTLYGWLELLRGSALLAIAGVAVALTVWRISYPRVTPPPAPPA